MRQLTAAALLLAALASSPTSGAARAAQSAPAATPSGSIAEGVLQTEYVGRGTRRNVEVGPARFDQIGALPRLQVDLRNPTRRDRRYEYRIEWRDAEGGRAQTTSVWRSAILGPGETQSLVSIGQTPQARDATLSVRETPVRPPEPEER